ncbi:hypothetical protein [Streptomyces gobitricini]|uniref:hypothetical protein n=1 Tax=Streptomyces gobitricini TaxID=68211 RepID=UPI0031E07C2E
MKRTRRRSELASLAAWWAILTAALWLLATVCGQRTTLWGCAASAAFFVAVGEAGDRLRRRYTRRTAPDASRANAPGRGA